MYDRLIPLVLLALVSGSVSAAEPETVRRLPPPLTLAESLTPYSGSSEKGVDCTTLHGKVMCGYQGWFMTKEDSYGMGDVHWGGVNRNPPSCTVDFWPDVSELGDDEKFPTAYKHKDGSAAFVFSSTVAKTVERHFLWMKEAGIDGVFVQRFDDYLHDQHNLNYRRACAVLHHVREAANRNGRAYAVMYDMHFDRGGVDVVKADWTRLLAEMRITRDPAYLQHRGRPVVSLWGYGFPERGFDAAAVESFLKYLQSPEGGGCTIMLGTPNDWVHWTGDRMRLLTKYATVVSPWNVGRYHDEQSAKDFLAAHWPADLAFCREHDKDYYAVAFPGFSWHNLRHGRTPLDQIPRQKGKFFWSQVEEIKRYGMDMAYIAMFDEVDEGTAIFKCTNDPPQGDFCTYAGLPSDFYLKLTGKAGRFLRGEAK
jgi:hypothetical protein